MRRIVSAFFTCLLAPAAFAALQWANDHVAQNAGPLDENAEVIFAFTNTGPNTVTITEVVSNCGCTVPSLEKLEYWVVGGRLERRGYPELDGSIPSQPAVLVEDVIDARFRFRDEHGAWRDDWTGKRADALPRAVELTLVRATQPPVTFNFLVGPGGVPPRGAVTGG